MKHLLEANEDQNHPQVREQLIELHQQLFKVVNEGSSTLDVCTVFELVDDIEDRLERFIQTADHIKRVVGSVNQLLPTTVAL